MNQIRITKSSDFALKIQLASLRTEVTVRSNLGSKLLWMMVIIAIEFSTDYYYYCLLLLDLTLLIMKKKKREEKHFCCISFRKLQ